MNFIVAGIGLGVTAFSVIWNLADTKRKLENQFQQSQKDIELAKKDMLLSEMQLEIKVQGFYMNTKEVISALGSQVDFNSGALAAFKSLRTNSIVNTLADKN